MILQIFYRAIIPFAVMSFISLILFLQEKNYQAKGTFITSLIILSSCSVYEGIKETAGDAYEWSKDKKDQAVDAIDEAVSE